MRISIILGLAFTLAVSPASAKLYGLKLHPVGSQTVRYDRGSQYIDSVMPSAVVRLVEIAEFNKRVVSFRITVLSTARQPFLFGPGSVVVRPTGLEALTPLTYEQAMQEESKQRKRDNFRAGLAAFGRNMSASSAGAEEGSGTYHGVGGSGSFTYGGNDASAEAIARREADEESRHDRAEIQSKWAMREAERSIMLRDNTVDPGTIYGGVATLSLPEALRNKSEPTPVTVEVEFGGEHHEFAGSLVTTN